MTGHVPSLQCIIGQRRRCTHRLYKARELKETQHTTSLQYKTESFRRDKSHLYNSTLPDNNVFLWAFICIIEEKYLSLLSHSMLPNVPLLERQKAGCCRIPRECQKSWTWVLWCGSQYTMVEH